MVWFLEKQDCLVVFEIRRAADNPADYEFEIADATGPTTQRFGSPADLISSYLTEHSRLVADGWQPRAGNVTPLE